MSTLGQRLIHARERRQMTQVDLAKALGITQQAVSLWESGKKKHLRSDTIVRLCHILQCSADYLLGMGEEQQPKAA